MGLHVAPGSRIDRPLRLAVADDDAATLALLSEWLPSLGYVVTALTNSFPALAEACWADRPDAALVDVRMPATDGFFCVSPLRAMGVGVALMTAGWSDAQAGRAGALGASCVSKPLDAGEVARAVLAAINAKARAW